MKNARLRDKLNSLVGKQIEFIGENKHADEGFVMRLSDGTIIRVGYSSQEGGVSISNDTISGGSHGKETHE